MTRMRRSLPLGLSMVVAGCLAVAALGATRPVNLVATPTLKAQLRTAHLRATGVPASKIRGPLKGQTYYARLGTTHWALATFSQAGVGTEDQPEAFRRLAGGKWSDRGDNGQCKVPRAVITLWNLKRLLVAC
ncbi:MAG: hypothetical protein QOE36_2125 [Gaiellaceae bacterium]|nr:hypothetical protein [Gaiellaceae bacterium]